jgi:hypothetical protein
MSDKTKEGQLLLRNCRLGYPKLFVPEAVKASKDDPNPKKRYGAAIYLPKTDVKAKAAIDAEIERLSKVHFKGKVPKSSDLFIKDGDGEHGDDNTKGCWIISANRAESQKRPQVVDKDGRTPLDSQDSKPYAGCRCNFLISVYVPGNWAKVCSSLEICQFVADDEPFGAGSVKAEDVMPDLSDEDDDI